LEKFTLFLFRAFLLPMPPRHGNAFFAPSKPAARTLAVVVERLPEGAAQDRLFACDESPVDQGNEGSDQN